MAWHDLGNKPINSGSTGPIGAGSSATLYAELDSTVLGTASFAVGQSRLFQVTYVMGADTNVTWRAGTASSTDMSTGGVDEFFPKTPTGQSAQYVLQHVLEKDYRVRVRQYSSGAGGAAYLSAVPLT